MLKMRTVLLLGVCILTIAGCSRGQNIADEERYTVIGESQKGNSIFPDDIIQKTTKMILWKDDNIYYEISDPAVLLEVVNSLLEMDYIEIENPWLEGGKFLNIYSADDMCEFWLSSDVISFVDKVYHVPEKNIENQLLEIFIENGQKKNSENE